MSRKSYTVSFHCFDSSCYTNIENCGIILYTAVFIVMTLCLSLAHIKKKNKTKAACFLTRVVWIIISFTKVNNVFGIKT